MYHTGLIQNAIVKSTDEDVLVQRDGLHQRMASIIEAASLAKVNVLCFQEAWSKYLYLLQYIYYLYTVKENECYTFGRL